MKTSWLAPWILTAFCLVVSCGALAAQEADSEKEGVAILELGAEQSWSIKGGAATYGPNVAVEVTPIEKWLEIEAGVTPFFTRNATEWDTDLLFKKPWTISRKVEFMAGIGPEWIHLHQNGVTTNSFATEVAGDFMFWPAKPPMSTTARVGTELPAGPG